MKRSHALLGIAVLAALPLAGCGNHAEPPSVGTLERDRYDLVAEAYEPIAQILVKEGDHVTAGQPLLKLDTSRIDAQRMNKDGLLMQARGRLAELERDYGEMKEAGMFDVEPPTFAEIVDVLRSYERRINGV